MRRLVLWAPLALFMVFLVVAAARLAGSGDAPPQSRLVGRELPAFALPPALSDKPAATSALYGEGEARLLNVFASWCVPCIAEAPHLEAIAARGIPIDAVAIRDRPEDIARFLTRHGDPYHAIGLDEDSTVQMALGSSGVPETFVIDGAGIIRHHHVGAINAAQVADLVAAYEAAR